MTERLHFHFPLACIGEGNGNPLQCSCLENPRDRGAWWGAISGVAQSRTRLKRLSSSSSSMWQLQVLILGLSAIFFPQIFSICRWLDPWMHNPQFYMEGQLSLSLEQVKFKMSVRHPSQNIKQAAGHADLHEHIRVQGMVQAGKEIV